MFPTFDPIVKREPLLKLFNAVRSDRKIPISIGNVVVTLGNEALVAIAVLNTVVASVGTFIGPRRMAM